MTPIETLRRAATAALSAAALVVGLSAFVVTPSAAAQPGNCCCPPGQTGVIYGCAPFCIEGKYLDANTGLCTPIAQPAPPARA
ncbi:hypothetical protein C731_4204 [Mycolicibacterium hassiacum DSM 44199]|jgi:hypothetical protein|uniref:Uncharacterized protein n=1 Tax=Mycolicibacterium hassiacum (strain DSM 44199 / CIP 105218 / JCM 12690 / 3849) TaxID=1122247 RepID=K5B7E5_MYCHD|nr:hypothetical protein [Mycolicibacterium hassiacum]EKF21808.1 hypothetical protein C731_4204 [Mycolicibacterium hassiacum DSM 44199]MDA4085437.1 hypothetical protein [Mycolicibacterium hassiacum DSM 44199]PZN19712.1 MAG: hypothetical protein DIU75_14155 [Mycolicibacterium hassiacum]VCT92624.1 hypothetical protein MHAS_04354 [Mycolicibacterium hassiacum DSM 44199]